MFTEVLLLYPSSSSWQQSFGPCPKPEELKEPLAESPVHRQEIDIPDRAVRDTQEEIVHCPCCAVLFKSSVERVRSLGKAAFPTWSAN